MVTLHEQAREVRPQAARACAAAHPRMSKGRPGTQQPPTARRGSRAALRVHAGSSEGRFRPPDKGCRAATLVGQEAGVMSRRPLVFSSTDEARKQGKDRLYQLSPIRRTQVIVTEHTKSVDRTSSSTAEAVGCTVNCKLETRADRFQEITDSRTQSRPAI